MLIDELSRPWSFFEKRIVRTLIDELSRPYLPVLVCFQRRRKCLHGDGQTSSLKRRYVRKSKQTTRLRKDEKIYVENNTNLKLTDRLQQYLLIDHG